MIPWRWIVGKKEAHPSAGRMKVAVCEYLLEVNRVDPDHPLIPPTAIDWLGNGIVSAVLADETEGEGVRPE